MLDKDGGLITQNVDKHVLRILLSRATFLQPLRNNVTLDTLMQNGSYCSVNLLRDLEDFLLNFGLSPSVTPEKHKLRAQWGRLAVCSDSIVSLQ